MATLSKMWGSYRHHVPIKGVIFDNDGTLYTEPSNAKEIHEKAAIEAVRAHGIEKSDAEIRGLFAESRKSYGNSLGLFTHEYGIEPESLRNAHYDALIQIAQGGDFFDPGANLRDELSILRLHDINLYIATHGNEKWTGYSNKENGIDHIFNDSAACVCSDGVQPGKNQGPDMYRKVLDIAGVDPLVRNPGSGYAMVEDTPENLRHAKSLGMMTIALGKFSWEERRKHPYVDVFLENPHDVANVILDSNRFHEKMVGRHVFFPSKDVDSETNVRRVAGGRRAAKPGFMGHEPQHLSL